MIRPLMVFFFFFLSFLEGRKSIVCGRGEDEEGHLSQVSFLRRETEVAM